MGFYKYKFDESSVRIKAILVENFSTTASFRFYSATRELSTCDACFRPGLCVVVRDRRLRLLLLPRNGDRVHQLWQGQAAV